MAKAANASAIVSIRVTPAERQLIDEAAAKKGLKAATFIRVSALERAAHVLNLSRPTSFDFSAVARRLAEALVEPRSAEIFDNGSGKSFGRFGPGPIEEDRVQNHGVALDESALGDFHPRPFTVQEIEQLRDAIRLGGLDFAAQLITDCYRMASATSDLNLPAPIDPAHIEEQEEQDE